MTERDDDTALTLDDEQIVTRRRAIGLAALVLGAAGTLVSGRSFAAESEEGDKESESDDAEKEGEDDSAEKEKDDEEEEKKKKEEESSGDSDD